MLAAQSGCVGATIRAADLPAHMVARPISNAQTLDLSRLAGQSVANDRIFPGDVLSVTVAAGLGMENVFPLKVRVGEDGFANLPHIGAVPVAGLEFGEAEAAIGRVAIDKRIFTAPHVVVTMHTPKTSEITVVGAVNNPGVKKIPTGSADLLTALTAAGSLNETAGTRVEIKVPAMQQSQPLVAGLSNGDGGVRTAGHSQSMTPDRAAFASDIQLAGYQLTTDASGGQLVSVDLASAIAQGKQGPRLPDGAVVSVETRDPQPIFVNGLVARPDRYEYPVGEELRLLEAISMAGDLRNQLADKVYVIRKSQNAAGQIDHAVIKVSYQKAKFDPTENLVLMPGDEVSVERTPLTVALDVFKTVGFSLSGRAF